MFLPSLGTTHAIFQRKWSDCAAFVPRCAKECRTLVPCGEADAFAPRIGQSKPCHALSCFQLDSSCLRVCKYMPSLIDFWDLAWLTCPFINPSSKCLRLSAYRSLCPCCYFKRCDFHFASYILLFVPECQLCENPMCTARQPFLLPNLDVQTGIDHTRSGWTGASLGSCRMVNEDEWRIAPQTIFTYEPFGSTVTIQICLNGLGHHICVSHGCWRFLDDG